MAKIITFFTKIFIVVVNFIFIEKLLLKNFANSKIIYNFAPKTETNGKIDNKYCPAAKSAAKLGPSSGWLVCVFMPHQSGTDNLMQGKLIYKEAGFPIGKLAPFSFVTF